MLLAHIRDQLKVDSGAVDFAHPIQTVSDPETVRPTHWPGA
ncbi:hypothetical protein [Cognatishimia sp.]